MSTFVSCDLCGGLLEGGRDNSAYVYLEWKMSGEGKGMIPRQKQDDYCSPCTSKVQTAIARIRREQSSGGSKPETPDTNPPLDLSTSLPKPEVAAPRQKLRS